MKVIYPIVALLAFAKSQDVFSPDQPEIVQSITERATE